MKTIFGATCSGLATAVLLSTTALAQDAASQSGTARQENIGNEIVVTAQFRSQRVQDTPIAISALDSRMLEQKGATDIVGAANLAPNVQLASSAGNFGGVAAIFIRGIGQSDPHFAVEPGVGMYVDDVYYGVLTGAIFDLLDVDRVEVLRGPQGTLAGKNSIGGSIKLFSRRPTPDPDAFVEVGYGSRNATIGRAATNLTLVPDRLFARISVGAKFSEGYVDQLDFACAAKNFSNGSSRTGVDCKIGEQGGQQIYSARGSLLWKPSDGIEDLLIVDILRDRSQNAAAKTLVQSPLWAGANNYITGANAYTNYENYLSAPTDPFAGGAKFTLPSSTPLDVWGISNNLSVDLGSVKLTSISAFRRSKITLSSAADGTPAAINDQVWSLEHRQFTQELRLNGKIGAIADWTLGGFYYHADGVSGGRVDIPGGLAPGGGGLNLDILFRDPVATESKSAFLHTVWHATAKLNLIAAVRYTRDSKAFTFNRYNIDGSPHWLLGALVNLPVTYKGDRTDYRLGIDYSWSRDVMTYAQVSTGYKGGGVNPRPFFVSQAIPYQPEKLTAYEVGFKSQIAHHLITLNAAAFLNDYKDFQATLRICDSISPFPGAPCAQSTNVGNAEIKGFEVESVVRPIDGLTIDGSLGYLDFRYKKVNPATGIQLGMTNVYTPEWTGAAGIQYRISIRKAGSVTPRFDLSYRSQVQTDPINAPISEIPDRAVVNASLAWRSTDGGWEARLSVTNLADKFYYNSKFLLANAPYFAGVGNVAPPRTFLFTIKRNLD